MSTISDNTVQVNAQVDSSGNSYTSAVSNNQLTNSDFLTLMIEELKLQDPTKPVDSNQMLQSQMQMSTIETNTQMIKAMEAMSNSFTQSTLANASNIIGKIVETGEIGESGITKGYEVSSVEMIDGKLYVNAYEIVGFNPETGQVVYDSEPTTIDYNKITRINEGIPKTSMPSEPSIPISRLDIEGDNIVSSSELADGLLSITGEVDKDKYKYGDEIKVKIGDKEVVATIGDDGKFTALLEVGELAEGSYKLDIAYTTKDADGKAVTIEAQKEFKVEA